MFGAPNGQVEKVAPKLFCDFHPSVDIVAWRKERLVHGNPRVLEIPDEWRDAPPKVRGGLVDDLVTFSFAS